MAGLHIKSVFWRAKASAYLRLARVYYLIGVLKTHTRQKGPGAAKSSPAPGWLLHLLVTHVLPPFVLGRDCVRLTVLPASQPIYGARLTQRTPPAEIDNRCVTFTDPDIYCSTRSGSAEGRGQGVIFGVLRHAVLRQRHFRHAIKVHFCVLGEPRNPAKRKCRRLWAAVTEADAKRTFGQFVPTGQGEELLAF